MQPVDLHTSRIPSEGWAAGLGSSLKRCGPAAEGRCAPAGGAFVGLGGGAWEVFGAADGGGDVGRFGGALYSGRFDPAFRQLRLPPRWRLR